MDIRGGSGRVFGSPKVILESPRGPQGSKMKLGEDFGKALGGLGKALGGFGSAWEATDRPPDRPTAYIY